MEERYEMNNKNEDEKRSSNEYKYKVTATGLSHSSAGNGLEGL